MIGVNMLCSFAMDLKVKRNFFFKLILVFNNLIAYIDHTTERCLSYDEKPLLLFQKLKEANQNPVFMLKNIKEIKSPVATAEEIINSLKASKSKRRTTQF